MKEIHYFGSPSFFEDQEPNQMSNIPKNQYVNKTILANGLTIITESIPFVKSVSAGIWVKTGSRYETIHESGITHFLEHMLFKGTAARTSFDIASQIESRGGYLNAFTSNEYTAYYVRCLDSELPTALDVLSDMVLRASLPNEEIGKEKKVVIEEMKMYRDSPDDYLFEEFISQIFDNHPLGRPIIGYESTVNNFTREQLVGYISDHYRNGNLILAVTGNVNHDEVVNLVEKEFILAVGDSTPKQHVLTPYKPSKKELTKDIEQTHYFIGKRGLGSVDVDRYKLLMLNAILGGGMSSRLHQNIREKYGYCYTIQSMIQSFSDTGIFAVYTGTDKQHLTHVKDLVVNEFDKLKNEELTEKEFNDAKTQLKGLLLLNQESTNNRMVRMAKSEIYHNRYVTLEEIEEKINAVTTQELLEFSNSFLTEESLSESILTPSLN